MSKRDKHSRGKFHMIADIKSSKVRRVIVGHAMPPLHQLPVQLYPKAAATA
jgi:hypothetical protein